MMCAFCYIKNRKLIKKGVDRQSRSGRRKLKQKAYTTGEQEAKQ